MCSKEIITLNFNITIHLYRKLSGIALDYGLNGWGLEMWQGLGIFLFTTSRPALGPTQPPIQWVLGAISLGVKWQGMKLYLHSPIYLHGMMLS
jgi:hypothetical protein